MEEFVAIEGGSQGEEYILEPSFCNFSTITDKYSLSSHDLVVGVFLWLCVPYGVFRGLLMQLRKSSARSSYSLNAVPWGSLLK